MPYKPIQLILIILCLTTDLYGQPFTEKKTYIKSLAVNKEMTLEVNNKYGSIQTNYAYEKDLLRVNISEVRSRLQNLEKRIK